MAKGVVAGREEARQLQAGPMWASPRDYRRAVSWPKLHSGSSSQQPRCAIAPSTCQPPTRWHLTAATWSFVTCRPRIGLAAA